MPQLLGKSRKTLVEDNEIFIFEDEVLPILSVLCGKTLEIARMEVLQEEELKKMAEEQKLFERLQEQEDAIISEMEQDEKNRLNDFN